MEYSDFENDDFENDDFKNDEYEEIDILTEYYLMYVGLTILISVIHYGYR